MNVLRNEQKLYAFVLFCYGFVYKVGLSCTVVQYAFEFII